MKCNKTFTTTVTLIYTSLLTRKKDDGEVILYIYYLSFCKMWSSNSTTESGKKFNTNSIR